MFSPGEPATAATAWRPRGARPLATALAAVDRVFERAYSSALNPLHRAGTLAVLFLAVALVTGVYLLCVYEIGRPYESVLAIQRDPLLGRWMRALHRYASDAAVVAVVLHVLRLLVQGKTWGPRALAWVTGVLLTGMMFVSAITGFVLVWDRFAQALAVTGARMLRVLPLFPEPPDRAFVGDAPVPAQFFFMNLFLHVAVPLGMVCFLWLHTGRLAHAAWFPERRVTIATVAGLGVLAVVWPAPLPAPADLLALPGRVPADWFYAFWLPFAVASPVAALLAGGALTALLVGVPWLVRPRRSAAPTPAFADPHLCEGCEQCRNDCPFDAIEMVTGLTPELHPLRAEVHADRCTSCGLCAGSCASLAIGPRDRTARDQLAAARRLVAGIANAEHRTLLVACGGNDGLASALARRFAADDAVAWFPVECAGTLHPGTVSYLGSHFGGTLVVACPPAGCRHRLGAELADARIVGEQRPAVPGRLARLPVRLLHAGPADLDRVAAAVASLRRSDVPVKGARSSAARRRAGALALGAAVLGGVALGSRWPQGASADHAVLRLGWRLPAQSRETCRDLTAAELAARPVHMRRTRECVSEPLTYVLTATVDGRVVTDKRVRPAGLRGDRPLSVEEEVPVAPGERGVRVTFAPESGDAAGQTLVFDGRVRFERGRVALVSQDGQRLRVR
jgi:ferredoxin